LGISADIYLGYWEDNKYVADRNKDVNAQIAENLLGEAADQGRKAFKEAYLNLNDEYKAKVKPFLALFEKRVKKADEILDHQQESVKENPDE
jgi:hypothetical protein